MNRFIDLGLPSHILWAENNLSASNIFDYGDYHDFNYVINFKTPKLFIPTKENFNELLNNTWHVPIYDCGKVKGIELISIINHNSIVFPFNGFMDAKTQTLECIGKGGHVWSSTIQENNPNNAFQFGFTAQFAYCIDYNKSNKFGIRLCSHKNYEL